MDTADERRSRNRRCNIIWSKEMVRKLIDLVKENECLWNYGSADYSIRTLKKIAWREIEKKLGVDADEPMNKWNSLRTGFRKAIINKNGDGKNRKSKSQNIEAMNFLLPIMHIEPKDRQASFEVIYNESLVSANSDDASLISSETSFNEDNKNDIELFTEDLPRPLLTPIPSEHSEKHSRVKESPEITPKDTLTDIPFDPFRRRFHDDFVDVGNFVASNMRQWNNQPHIVEQFRENLYALIYQSQVEYNRRKLNK